MSTLGIDPGADGGLALIDGDRIEITPMPYVDKAPDIQAIVRWIQHVGIPDLAVIEKQQARQGNASGPSFTQGTTYGELRGAIRALGIPLETKDPKVWQKALGLTQAPRKKAADKKADDRLQRAHRKKQKQKHIGFALERWPHLTLLANERCKVPHDGMADALCIAEYGRRHLA